MLPAFTSAFAVQTWPSCPQLPFPWPNLTSRWSLTQETGLLSKHFQFTPAPNWRYSYYRPGTAPGFDYKAHPATAAPVMVLTELDNSAGYVVDLGGGGPGQGDEWGVGSMPVLATLDIKAGLLTVAPGVDRGGSHGGRGIGARGSARGVDVGHES